MIQPFFFSLSVKNTLTKELDRGDEVIMSFLSNFGAIKLHFCVGYVICHYNEKKYRFGKIHCCFVPSISHSLYNFPISTLIRLLVDSVRWLVRLLIDWSGFRWVGHNFLKGLVVTLPCSYRSTCFPTGWIQKRYQAGAAEGQREEVRYRDVMALALLLKRRRIAGEEK